MHRYSQWEGALQYARNSYWSRCDVRLAQACETKKLLTKNIERYPYARLKMYRKITFNTIFLNVVTAINVIKLFVRIYNRILLKLYLKKFKLIYMR